MFTDPSAVRSYRANLTSDRRTSTPTNVSERRPGRRNRRAASATSRNVCSPIENVVHFPPVLDVDAAVENRQRLIDETVIHLDHGLRSGVNPVRNQPALQLRRILEPDLAASNQHPGGNPRTYANIVRG